MVVGAGLERTHHVVGRAREVSRTFSQTSSPVMPGIIHQWSVGPLRARHASSPGATTVTA